MFRRWSPETPIRTLLLMACTVVGLYVAVGLGHWTIQWWRLHDEQVQLRRDLVSLHQRERTLIEERDRLTSTQDVEAIARREMNLIKPGETAVIVYPAPHTGSDTAAEPAPPPAAGEPSWLGRLFGR